MRLPGLDVVFGLAAPAIDILIKGAGVVALQVRDDEACVGPIRAGLDAGDDTLDATPAFGAVEELLEAAHLAILGRSLKARFRSSFEAFDMAAQRRGRRHAQNVIEPLWPDTSREPRDSNSDYRRAVESRCRANWRGSPAEDGAGRPGSPCRQAVWRGEARRRRSGPRHRTRRSAENHIRRNVH